MGDARVYTGCSNRGRGMPRREFGEHGKGGGRPGVSAPGRISPTPHAPCRNRLMGKLKPPGTPLATLRCQLWHDVKIPWPAEATTGTGRAWKRGGRPGVYATGLLSFSVAWWPLPRVMASLGGGVGLTPHPKDNPMGKSFSYIIYVYMIIDIVAEITRRREGESTGNNQATKSEGMRPPRHQGRPPDGARAIKPPRRRGPI